MELACGTADINPASEVEVTPLPARPQQRDEHDSTASVVGINVTVSGPNQQQQQQQKTKRKHRRGKPKPKNSNKPYKKTNWKFQIPRLNYKGGNNGIGQAGGGGAGGGGNSSNGTRAKLARSRSLVPYNTNKFLMEEHMADVPSALLTPSGRTRDSSFSVDSDDNYFYSLPEDEEEFLTKEFANVYEKARVERLDNLTKQQLIEECLQIEDRYSSDQGTQRQQQLNVQRISSEFMAKIRVLEEKIRELSRDNYELRCQLMRSAATAASPPSAAAPTGSACQPTPMDSSSQDSESDSSSTSSSSPSSSSAGEQEDAIVDGDNRNYRQHRRQSRRRDAADIAQLPDNVEEDRLRRRSGSSSKSSLSEYNAAAVCIENDCFEQQPLHDAKQQLLEAYMEEDDRSNQSNGLLNNIDEEDEDEALSAVAIMAGTLSTPSGTTSSTTQRTVQTPP